MVFDSHKYDGMVRRLVKVNSQKAKLSYLGPREENTYHAWYGKGFEFPYGHVKMPKEVRLSERMFCGQREGHEQGLRFDSLY